MHQKGEAGLPKDYSKAKEYWLKAASQKPYVKSSGQQCNKVMPNDGVAAAENRLVNDATFTVINDESFQTSDT